MKDELGECGECVSEGANEMDKWVHNGSFSRSARANPEHTVKV